MDDRQDFVANLPARPSKRMRQAVVHGSRENVNYESSQGEGVYLNSQLCGQVVKGDARAYYGRLFGRCRSQGNKKARSRGLHGTELRGRRGSKDGRREWDGMKERRTCIIRGGPRAAKRTLWGW